jgi:hypothetical protein
MNTTCTLIPTTTSIPATAPHYSPKDTVARLWDCQTRAEMTGREQEQYGAAKRFFRECQFTCAKEVLASSTLQHAEALNLLGLVHESLKEFEPARKCYGKAVLTDKHYLAAEMNLGRMYELHTFGRSSIPMYF